MFGANKNERKGLGQMKRLNGNFDHQLKIAVPAILNTTCDNV